MIDFKPLQLKDINVIKPYLYDQKNRICDYTIGGIMMWRSYFHTEYCIIEETLLLKVTYLSGEVAFSYPVGKHHKSILRKLQDYCIQKEIRMEFCTITEDNLTHLKQVFPSLEIHEERDWFDYLYEGEALKTFPGKKYNKIRNHLNKFQNCYPNWRFEVINEVNIMEVSQFYDTFLKNQTKENTSTSIEESLKVTEVLENYKLYELIGGILRVNGNICAFCLGEIIHDTLYVHIEKADIKYHGAYQKIVSCFAQEFVKDDVRYINREEDVGDEGLRKSKLAYRPISLIEKYTVRVR